MKRTLALCACLITAPAVAQQQLPFAVQQSNGAQPGYYTTRDTQPTPPVAALQGGAEAPAAAPLPWHNQQPAASGGTASPPVQDQLVPNVVPFQRATPYGSQAVPAPLPMERSVPVENIDGIEVTEPAAPAEIPVDMANPATDDPSAPTELTSPLFAADTDKQTPRMIVLRVLNKVTGRAEELKARPDQTIAFGKLSIFAQQCYRSAPNSQPDTVALLTISEVLPEQKEPRMLFHGWMYESSPSLTSLEHPIYDVTMVDCDMTAKPSDALDEGKEKPAKKTKKN